MPAAAAAADLLCKESYFSHSILLPLLPLPPPHSGKRFIFEKAAELGVKAIVLDGPDSWAQLLEKEGVIASFCPIDFSDAEHVFDNCLKARWRR